MAAGSAGMPDMVSEEEQPIDLSRSPRKPLRLMPPLIPIRLLKAGYNHRQVTRQDIRSLPKLTPTRRNEPIPEKFPQGWREQSPREEEEEEEEEDSDEVSRKRVRLENGLKEEEACDSWLSQRLDRARSVPQLTPLPIPLQRCKSLSESRIPVATSARAVPEDGSDWRLEQQHEEELRQRLQMATDLQNPGDVGADNQALLKSSWIYVGYYSHLLRRFQAQEMLRQIALQHQRDPPEEQNAEDASLKIPKSVPPTDDGDIKRRQPRPLTGKHVRPGTGASPSTLLTLRRKIQARQQQHDPKSLHK